MNARVAFEYKHASDVDLLAQYATAQIDVSRFGRTELDEATLVLNWPDLKAFHTTFTRWTPEGEVLGQADAIWVVVREGAFWKLKFRIGAVPVKRSRAAPENEPGATMVS